MNIKNNHSENDHLSHEAIYEFLRLHADEQISPSHIEYCSACRQDYDAARLLFTRLKHESQVAPNGHIWSRIETQHQLNQQKNRNRFKDWSFVSIAASLLLIIGIQWTNLNSERSADNQIQAAIIRSQQLEQQTQQNIQPANYQVNLSIIQELQNIDEDLQLAYQQNKRQAIILDLWKKRIEVLIRANIKTNNNHNVETI